MGLMKRILDSRMGKKVRQSFTWEGPFDMEIESPLTDRYQRSQDSRTLEEYNQELMAWASSTIANLRPSLSAHAIKGSKLRRSLRNNYKKEYGEIYRIGFTFSREGVFIHKGVGRGYVMRGGVVVKTSKTNGFNRRAKPWFNPIIEQNLPALGEIVQKHTEKSIINATRIFIR